MRVVTRRSGAWATTEEDALSAANIAMEAREDPNVLAWLRAGGAPKQQLMTLGKQLGLHPLALEDVQNTRQRPKVEDYGDIVFVVVRVPRYDGEVSWKQVGIFLGPDFVVTASEAPLPELDAVEARMLKRGLPEDRGSACFLFYLILDALVDAWFPYMDALEEHLDDLEDKVLEEATQALLADIRNVKHTISRTRKVSGPMRDAALALERGDHRAILPATKVYLRDVSDHMVRITERLDHVKETSLIAQETWNATLANRQNELMKRLTVVAALLLLPGLLAGLGGMNFERGFPAWGYWPVVATIFGIVVLGIGAARWKRWL